MTDTAREVKDVVSPDRWAEAQEWERESWISTERQRARWCRNMIWPVLAALKMKPRFRGNDWNDWWADRFDRYRFLPRQVSDAIELGCGPYTNWRIISEHCRADHLVLSDPLIRTYVRFPHTFVRHAYREALCSLDDHTIECAPFADNTFDVVIMINVLDHVQDARRCMCKALGLVKAGGWLIIGQELSDATDLAKLGDAPGHEGHPIAVDEPWMRTQLGTVFAPHVERVLTRQEGRDPSHHYGTFLFAGTKRDAETA